MNSGHRQIARAAGIVMAAFVASRVLGLARDVVIAAQLGTSDAADAYYAAFCIPDTIFLLIAGGALASAFIPTFADYWVHDDKTEAWRLASGVINLLLVATAHKIARIFYFMLKHRKPFHDIGAEAYGQHEREREVARLQKKAAKLGFTLVQSSDQPAQVSE